MGDFADYAPNQILRMIQFGLKERVLRSSPIWLCLSCEACSVRCPNGIKIPEVMDVLREMAFKQGLRPREKNALIFHNVFLDSVKNRGRIHEALMMVKYKIKSGDFFSDLSTGIKMFKKGKFPVITKSTRDKKEVKKIFRKIIEDQEKKEKSKK